MFHQVLELLDLGGWQVRQDDQGLHALVTNPGRNLDAKATARRLQQALTRAGAETSPISVSIVDSIAAGAAGKRPLVIAQPDAAAR